MNSTMHSTLLGEIGQQEVYAWRLLAANALRAPAAARLTIAMRRSSSSADHIGSTLSSRDNWRDMFANAMLMSLNGTINRKTLADC